MKIKTSNVNSDATVTYVKSLQGYDVKKRCASCQHSSACDDKDVKCYKLSSYVAKNGFCDSYVLHSRYDKVGESQGEVKEIEFFEWRLSIIKKFTKCEETDWKAHEEYIAKFGADRYEYWKNNVKNK